VLFVAVRNRDDSTMDITVNGQLYDNVLMEKTGDWNVYGQNTIPNVELTQGENVVRLKQERSLSSEPDKLELFLKTPLSVNALNLNEVTIYPNPSEGVFNIQSNIQNLEYTLINIQGQTLDKGKVSQKKVDFSNHSKGIYFLELASDSSKILKKLILK
jgi:hypothetical protein